MRSLFLFLLLWAGFADGQSRRDADPTTFLWYDAPAAAWDAALPVGNGRIGGMIFGGIAEEHIQLNEDTYWTGGPYSTVVPGGAARLAEVQKLVFEGKYPDAHNLFGRALMGYPVEQQKYQSLGDLIIRFGDGSAGVLGDGISGAGISAGGNPGGLRDYRRWLDLASGVSGVEYRIGDVVYRREVFVSAEDGVMVMRLTASRPGMLSFVAALRGARNQAHSNYATDYFRMDGLGEDGLILRGKSADYMGVPGRLRYNASLRGRCHGGGMRVVGAELRVEKADTVELVFSAATNFVNYKDVSGDADARADSLMRGAMGRSYTELRRRHAESYERYFGRVVLHLPLGPGAYQATDKRMKLDSVAADPSLAALAYQFGRYVLLSCSRPGGQAANLQGLWNKDMNPMWDAKYTTNINLQMAYWPVEAANLPECAEPLVKLVMELTDEGSKVAKEHYGCRGWVFHQNTDLWRVAAPMDGPTWGTFTVGGAWLCTHLWDHYLYTQDTVYLRSVYPVLKGAVEFFMDFLVARPGDGRLVTNPSTSPENFPARAGNGPYFDEVTGSILPGTTICAGSAIDMEIISELFDETIRAGGVLGVDASFADSVGRTRARLVMPVVGSDGALQEWPEGWGQLEAKHRHLSPLYGLFPGNAFSVEREPLLAAGARKVLEQRGDGSSGWSRAWKTACWTRLHEGNKAYSIFRGYLAEQANPQLFGKCGAPMQIDATMGMTAAISEMLVQSQEGIIELLPALPEGWADGEFDGVVARGGFVLSLRWKAGRVVSLSVFSAAGGVCRLRASPGGPVRELRTVKGRNYVVSLK